MTTPRVSILIPNFNNGRESSGDGTFDLLGTLLQSLHDTLQDDPMPVEIIIADDGSTDDSIETARTWAARSWTQGGRKTLPFCRLLELDHCGVLSKVANRLMAEAHGEVSVRLDGDVEVLTDNWATILCEAFDAMPENVGVIGPKQLTANGFVHSAGDWLLHPRGYHHIGQGITPSAVTRSQEVDHVMGCFYCQRHAVWESIGPYDESIMRGQTVDYGMRARLHGWRCVAIPDIEFIHHHTNRSRRSSKSDGDVAISAARDRFLEKWGFDRVAPDLDDVAERYRGTPLLWNARVFGPSANAPNPISIERSRWHAYAEDQRTQQVIANQLDLITKAIGTDQSRRIVQFGCGEGLLCHLLAQQGHGVTGFDSNPHLIELARSVTQRSSYDATAPRFVAEHGRQPTSVEAGSADVVLLIDVMHTHPNPVGLLKQARHVLADDGMLFIVMPERSTPMDTDVDRHHLYRDHELVAQINATGLFMIDRTFGPDIPGLLVKRCRVRSARAKPVEPQSKAIDSVCAATF